VPDHGQQGGADQQLRADLVFEGGGVKGIGLAGAFKTLTDRKYEPACVAGTSAGAITASLVASGYTGAELEDVVLHDTDFTKFEDGTFLHRFGTGGDIAQFLHSRGMHSGDYFLGWIRDLLRAKGKEHFGDLYTEPADDDQANDPKRIYKLQVIASDVSERSMLVLPRDAQKLGIEPDELGIAEAVRMSMSIPVFFEPVTHEGHEIVDGGMLSNFPIWLFDSDTAPRFPTFGMLLVAPSQSTPLLPLPPGFVPSAPRSEIDFVRAIAETMMEAHDRFYIEQSNFARTVPIPTLGVGTTEFNITKERTQAVYASGQQAAETFLDSWDFETYKATFRSGQAPGRRETLTAAPRGGPQHGA
jgi:NTE family protein